MSKPRDVDSIQEAVSSKRTADQTACVDNARQLPRHASSGGFSLVEVVIALAVMASAFLVVFGLLGVGMSAFHQSKAVTVSSQIAQQVFSELQTIQFNTLVGTVAPTRTAAEALNGSQSFNTMIVNGSSVSVRYFDDQGNELGSGSTVPANTIYWVNVRVLFPSPVPPATVSSANLSAGTLNIDLATVLVQVMYNPAGLAPSYDSTSTEWTGKTSTGAVLPIANYPCFVTRNS